MTPDPASGEQQSAEDSASKSRAQRSTLILTNLVVLTGVVIGAHEALFRDQVRDSVIVLAVVMVVGAQAVENILLHVIDRLFSRE